MARAHRFLGGDRYRKAWANQCRARMFESRSLTFGNYFSSDNFCVASCAASPLGFSFLICS
jgi:hypothetical protein